jgi:hypothetical protein
MSECPRWRLRTAHYLTIPTLPDGTKVEWEHKETNRESGRAIRKLYPVPMLVDPNDGADCNYPGEVIVAHSVDGAVHHRQDLIFLGDPTPDMEPLNEEAEAISDSHRQRWEHPVDTLPVNGGMTNQEQQFMTNMMTEFAKQIGATIPLPNASVPRADFDALKGELEQIKAMLAAKVPEGATSNVRRA